MPNLNINDQRLLSRISELGNVGRDSHDRLMRLAASDADQQGRDRVVSWMRDRQLKICIDRIGNILGIWDPASTRAHPVMMGSHIDSVANGGIYDGNYGVLAGLEVIETLMDAGASPRAPIAVAIFTNEEGARYQPDMMGSLVYAGGMAVETALGIRAADGTTLGGELQRIGYAGYLEPGFLQPKAFIEVHIEQGPVLEREGLDIGVVENLQGISWQEAVISGVANHAGTTPMNMRNDPGVAAARITTFIEQLALQSSPDAVATVGSLTMRPNVINVIPSQATLTLDLRDPDPQVLRNMEIAVSDYFEKIGEQQGVTIEARSLARFEPVDFALEIVEKIEAAAKQRQLSSRRMTSGAGHDAQMMARICPTAIIFVPSRDGISHNPREHTEPEQLVAGANVMLDVITDLLT